MDSLDFFHQLSRGTKFVKREAKPILIQKTAKRIKCEEELNKQKQRSAYKANEDHDDGDDAAEDAIDDDNEVNEFNTDIDEDSQNKNDDTAFEFISGGSGITEKTKKNKKKPKTAAERQQQQNEELINILRKEHRISVVGKNIPAPILDFNELRTDYNVHEQLVKNLNACNYPQPTPIQMQAIPIMLGRRPLMACAPTGSGKTIAFLTPIINDLRAPQKTEGFRALVLAPTRELAQQIYRECVRLAEKTALHIHIISKISQAKQKFGSNGKCDILISTPNRIRFLLSQEPPLLDLKSVKWFVLDEADRLMEEGQNNFKEQLDDILAACTNPNKNLALFSATFTAPVGKWAQKNLKNLVRLTVGHQNAATDSVEQELRFVGSESGKLIEIRNLIQEGLQPPVLIFVQSKERAKQLFDALLFDGTNVDIIHADRTQQQRDNCVRAFREGHIWVLICTELMSRGIDFKGVNLVINYDFPPTTISYIHRIGRAGRAGRRGRAITYYTQDDMQYLRNIAQIIKNSGGKVPDHMLHMKKMRKTETRRLAQYALKRDDINLDYTPEAEHKKKLKAKITQKLSKTSTAATGKQAKFKLPKTKQHKIVKNKKKVSAENDD